MHNTGNPLGSTQVLDLYDNSETIDNFVNSQQDETPDRFGTKRLTLAGLIKRSMALRNEINDFSGALTFRPEWSDVPMNVSVGVGGEGGALNLQAEALGNRSEINKVTSREALRRSYTEAGYNLVNGSFEAGGTLVNANDVLLQERTGKAFSGPAGTVAAGTNPASGGFVDKSGVATSASAISNANGGSVQDFIDFHGPNQKNGAFIIFDDATAVTKNDLMPVAVAEGFRAGLAVYHSGMSSSYSVVTMKEAQDFARNVDGEILSHSMNSVVLDGTVATSYAESMIKTSASEFRNLGFGVRGFVAPSSTLQAGAFKYLRESYDYAFIRSVGAGAGLNGINLPNEDRHNMVRVALTGTTGGDVITLAEAKAYVDLAKLSNGFIVFYAHSLPTYLTELMQYIQLTFRNITPAEFVGYYYGLNKDNGTGFSKNLLENSALLKINDADINPFKWVLDNNTLTAPSVTYTQSEIGNKLDWASNGNAGGESGTLRQNYSLDGLNSLTPFSFSTYCASLANQNTRVKMAMYLKNASNVTIASVNKTYTVAANRQRLEVSQAFIPDAAAAYLQVEITVSAIAAGSMRAILDSVKLEKSGVPSNYDKTVISEPYYNILRRTTGLTVSPNVDTLINFNGSLEGTNYIFDLTTGEALPIDGRVYELNVSVGLADMIVGDVMELHLLINGVPSRKSQHVCAVGTTIKQASWQIRADGRTYAVGIRHNSSAARALTTFGDATLTITSN